MKERADRDFDIFKADEDAVYSRVIDIDLSTVKQTVSFPHLPENTKTVDEITEEDVYKRQPPRRKRPHLQLR